MKNTKTKIKIYSLLLVFLIFSFSFYYAFTLASKNTLSVSFLDVGQGDSIFIKTPSGIKILMDAGKDNVVLTRLGDQLSFLEKDIDLVIGTHDDLDHIGGLPAVISKYNIGSVLLSLPESDSAANTEIIKVSKEKNIPIIKIENPKEILLEDGTKVEILFPVKDMNGAESNDASIVTKITYGNISFLLTGDLPQSGELFLVNTYGSKIKSDILKLGHHGSDTSSHPKFLETVSPRAVVISSGKNNTFGHPHRSVIDLINKFGFQIFRTDEMGTINFETDGIDIWQK